jgi:hypothetical protein
MDLPMTDGMQEHPVVCNAKLQVPEMYLARVAGIDAWQEDDGKRLACIAIQFAGHEQDGWPPKVVLVNKTTFNEHFEDVRTAAADWPDAPITWPGRQPGNAGFAVLTHKTPFF